VKKKLSFLKKLSFSAFMKGNIMILNQKLSVIKARAKIEEFRHEIKILSDSIDTAPLWRPGTALKKQCHEVLRLISDLEERFDRKLAVTILGPCGAGKSTLLNALAGVDNLSESSMNRPTTQNLIILCREKDDAVQFFKELDSKDVSIRSTHAASALENVLLIDTPDTDSTEREKHIPIVHKAIELSDILICIFDSENPKRMDYVDFLSPYVKLFKGESLVCVMNKSDRQDERELREVILPEFSDYIQKAWERSVEKVLCVSARRHLHQPDWDPKAVPRHDFDQFDLLQQMIFGTFNSAGFVIDRRLENAETLRDYILNEIYAEIGNDRVHLANAVEDILKTEKDAANNALAALKNENSRQVLGVNVLLYQKLAQRWLGPVGWLIALWARILIFGTGIAAIFRFGNPIRQIMGIASSIWNFKESRVAIAETGKSERVDHALRNYRRVIIQNWADIAELLVKARFDPSVRKIETILPDSNKLHEELKGLWNDALESAIEAGAQRLSRLILQFIFNIPVIAVLGYVGWITGQAFFAGNYLTSDFFLHAFLTIIILLFMSFFIFQGCVRIFAGTEQIISHAFENVKAETEEYHPASVNPIEEQAKRVLGMGRSVNSEQEIIGQSG